MIYIIGGGSGEMIVQQDTIFVSGMNPDLSEEDIAQYFGQIGVIKVSPDSLNFIFSATALCAWIIQYPCPI